jgi:putative phosphoesterase
MLRRVVVLADVHGVLPALQAVLAEPDVRSADRIVLAGDLAAGPQPVETLDLLASLGNRAVWIRGNTDRILVELARAHAPDPAGSDMVSSWAATQLRPDQLSLLAELPLSVSLTITGHGRVLCCHATPRDDEEMVLVDSSLERWAEVLSGVDDDVSAVLCGHTHMPFVRLVHGRLVVNPGSVGMPYGTIGAHWALLGEGVGVSLRRTSYDMDAACAAVTATSGYPKAVEWVDCYLRGRVSDVEAMAAFAARDGRQASSGAHPRP